MAAGSAVRQTNPTCGRPTLRALRQAYVDVLPAALFEAVQREAAAVAGESAKGDAFKFGKRTTWWLPLRGEDGARIPPRSAIEAAVHELHRQATRSRPRPIPRPLPHPHPHPRPHPHPHPYPNQVPPPLSAPVGSPEAAAAAAAAEEEVERGREAARGGAAAGTGIYAPGR